MTSVIARASKYERWLATRMMWPAGMLDTGDVPPGYGTVDGRVKASASAAAEVDRGLRRVDVEVEDGQRRPEAMRSMRGSGLTATGGRGREQRGTRCRYA
jgi:hypothetical protein